MKYTISFKIGRDWMFSKKKYDSAAEALAAVANSKFCEERPMSEIRIHQTN